MELKKAFWKLCLFLSARNILKCTAGPALRDCENTFDFGHELHEGYCISPIMGIKTPIEHHKPYRSPLSYEAAAERTLDDTPSLNIKETKAEFDKASSPLVVLDYDGTVTNLVRNKDEALPSKALYDALEGLDKKKHVTVAFISGRDKNFLDSIFKYENFIYCAERGAYCKLPGKDWVARTNLEMKGWKFLNNIAGSEVEEKEKEIVLHYRKAVDPVKADSKVAYHLGRLQAIASGVKSPKLKVSQGNKVLEITMAEVNKGEMLRELLSNRISTDFVLCLGDDRSDEDMFKTLVQNVAQLKSASIHTAIVTADRNKADKTAALSKMENPEAVIDLLQRLAAKES
ncbi:trehalose-phosphatase-domain-containing protein [Phakopsora pachyrhizi]|nr:trehalose-phosphatase-domain-containing protein [Phakopsora pachyrhizi]